MGYMASFNIKENINFATIVYVLVHAEEYLHVMQVNCNFRYFE
jgi:hypothetical protein